MIERCTAAALRRMARLATAVYDDALRPLGLKLTQYSLLINIRDSDAASVTELSDRMMMDRTTLTRNLAPLRKAGWVQVGDNDRRTRRIMLTEAGRMVLRQTVPVWRAAEKQVRDRIGTEESLELRERLDRASARLKAASSSSDGRK
ncbi:MAG: MarR family transcriptional regulator [Alphaproteobacteria bacterium]|nr:MarR family transcriptional regulator [Alphaproteobacteria bacterium]